MFKAFSVAVCLALLCATCSATYVGALRASAAPAKVVRTTRKDHVVPFVDNTWDHQSFGAWWNATRGSLESYKLGNSNKAENDVTAQELKEKVGQDIKRLSAILTPKTHDRQHISHQLDPSQQASLGQDIKQLTVVLKLKTQEISHMSAQPDSLHKGSLGHLKIVNHLYDSILDSIESVGPLEDVNYIYNAIDSLKPQWVTPGITLGPKPGVQGHGIVEAFKKALQATAVKGGPCATQHGCCDNKKDAKEDNEGSNCAENQMVAKQGGRRL